MKQSTTKGRHDGIGIPSATRPFAVANKKPAKHMKKIMKNLAHTLAVPRPCQARLLPLLWLLTLPTVLQAQYQYTINNGSITITSYTGPGGAVSIPSTINGLPVTYIGDNAFAADNSLTSVTIPNSVTSIGSEAFNSCNSLTSVTIGNSVTNIGNNAFSSSIGLASVTIAEGVTHIGRAAFAACIHLAKVTIPNSVTFIGDDAFNYCTSLTSVTIGNSVTFIGDLAFNRCTSLTTITVDALNSAYTSVDGVLFNKSQTTLLQCPASCRRGDRSPSA